MRYPAAKKAGDHPARRAIPSAGSACAKADRHPEIHILSMVRSLSDWRARGAGRSQVSARPPAAQSARSSSRATAPGGPPPPDTLYDQYDNPGTISSSSQNFESSSNSYDDELADDFVVPGGIGWNIEAVEVAGEYFNGPGPATSANVNFYSNGGDNRPGSLLASRPNQTFTGGPDFSVALANVVSLGPGPYWVSVQANQNFIPAGQWGWRNRTVQSNLDASWRNPGNGYGTGCTAWGPRTTCVGESRTRRIRSTGCEARPGRHHRHLRLRRHHHLRRRTT